MFGRGKEKPYDRQETLRQAEAFRAKGKTKKAAAQFQRVLERDPQDAEVHQKLAPLLASLGEHAGAAKSFRFAADALMAKGLADRAISIYLQVLQHQPFDTELWEKVAKLHLDRSRRADAIKVLSDGARVQKGKPGRPRAVRLLQCALALDPSNVPLSIEAARLLAKEGRKPEAKESLSRLAQIAKGTALKQVRRAQFSLWPSPASFWRYLRA